MSTGVGANRGGEEVEGQDVLRGFEALKVKDPSLSPRGFLGLKEARGEGRSFKCGETVGKSEDAAMHKDRRRGKLALSIIK